MAPPLTYNWPLQIQHQPTPQTTVRVRSTALGDGYEQVAEDGINTQRITYPLQHIGMTDEVKQIRDFLLAGVVTAFYFKPPHGELGLYRVVPDSVSTMPLSKRVGTVNASLRQCFGVGMRMA